MKVSIIGATGYAGAELLRLLNNHPEAQVVHITSESHTGEPISSIYPHLRGIYDQILMSMKNIAEIGADSDFIFIGLPNGHAMHIGKSLEKLPTRIIDLGADYRFTDTSVYEEWYKIKHTHKDAARVYGLAELNREKIKDAKIIGNAGCYTTASILALAPLAKNHLIDVNTIVVDAKSGVSGAGRSAKQPNHFPEMYDNFKAYNVGGHRHTPEIEQGLSYFAGEAVRVTFTPHLMPMSRGILATSYVQLKEGVDIGLLYEALAVSYDREPFVRILPIGEVPATRHVRGSNLCLIGLVPDRLPGQAIIVSVIDNLIKGASGQAVQNLNRMLGFEETLSLQSLPLFP